jgi:hypothetical protein
MTGLCLHCLVPESSLLMMEQSPQVTGAAQDLCTDSSTHTPHGVITPSCNLKIEMNQVLSHGVVLSPTWDLSCFCD